MGSTRSDFAVGVCLVHRAPQIADLGEEGRESWLELELKLVADVGIIGVPNAGKSTLLSVITAGQLPPMTFKTFNAIWR